ncbi:hypothetical protein GSY37_15325 [Listeria monocytogenes]|nr:hypothetical protein [Listeria monocytogenes]
MRNLTWNSNIVAWKVKGKSIQINLSNIISASINDEGVIIKCGKDFVEKQSYLYTDDGELIFKYDINLKEIFWLVNQNKLSLSNVNFIQALYIPKDNLIALLESDTILLGFDLDGIKKFETTVDSGYKFAYITENKNQLVVVCEGYVEHFEPFGRNRINFNVDRITGRITRLGIAY